MSVGVHQVQVGGMGHPASWTAQHELDVEVLLVLGWPVLRVQEQELHLDRNILALRSSLPSQMNSVGTASSTGEGKPHIYPLGYGCAPCAPTFDIQLPIPMSNLAHVLQVDGGVLHSSLDTVWAPPHPRLLFRAWLLFFISNSILSFSRSIISDFDTTPSNSLFTSASFTLRPFLLLTNVLFRSGKEQVTACYCCPGWD